MAFREVKLTREAILDHVKQIVLPEVEELRVKVYLFGSWAREDERRSSDIDVAIWSDQPLPRGLLAHIRFLLEESTVPYRVDLVDLGQADELLIEKVKKEGIVWKDYKKG